MKFKTDIPGHWVTHIKRGKLPLALEDRQALIKAHYQVFTTKTQSPSCKEALKKLGQPPLRLGEWAAIRRTWREESVRTVGNDAD